ncbi:hypothetical protein [Helicobacter sp. T3_23-1056]
MACHIEGKTRNISVWVLNFRDTSLALSMTKCFCISRVIIRNDRSFFVSLAI